MAASALDPATALILVDLQVGIAAQPLVHPIDEIAGRAAALAAAFRRHGLPVVLVNVAGGAPIRLKLRNGSRSQSGCAVGLQSAT